jgi:hypothetical protein
MWTINQRAAAMALVALSASAARADVIAGPTLNQNDSGYAVSGIGLMPEANTTLTSFTFQNQGLADVIDLVDASGDILDSAVIPAGAPSDTVPVNWALTNGVQYYLLQTTYDNGLFAPWGMLVECTDVCLTDTGVFSPAFSLDVTGSFTQGFAFWADFNNITTASGSVPEPASSLLILPGALVLFLCARGSR